MQKYNLIAFDMDGTLLNSQKQISQGNLKAIKDAVKAGKHVGLSTGRNMQELKTTIEDVPELSFVIAISGALITDIKSGKRIYSKAIPEDIVAKLFERTRSFDCMIHIHSDISLVQADKESHMADYNMGVYQGMFDRLTVKADSIEDYWAKERVPVYKFNYYCRSPRQRLEMHELLKDLPVTIAYAEDASLEISPLGVSKGSGLKALCDYYGIDIKESIAVGDAENDLEILKVAGLPLTMANSKPQVKKLGYTELASNDDDGCAEAVYKYLLK